MVAWPTLTERPLHFGTGRPARSNRQNLTP